MDDNGTYLGNIYGIYKACIANISIDIYDIKYKIITHTHRRRLRRPPHWVCVCDYFIFYIINIYGYISYTFLIYSIYAYMFPRYVPCIFPCVFLNLWSQEKISPYSKTTFLLLKFQGLRFLYFY